MILQRTQRHENSIAFLPIPRLLLLDEITLFLYIHNQCDITTPL